MTETVSESIENGSDRGFSPPYGSFRTLNKLFERMADEGGIPARIDRSYLSNLPNSVIATTTHALKALELTDENLHPLPVLVEIVEHPEQRKSLLAGVIQEKYRAQLALGMRATTAQLEASFRDNGVNGSTLRKAIAFFIAAARASEVPISPYFKTPKAPQSPEGRRRPKAVEPQPAPAHHHEAAPRSPRPAALDHELIAGLIRELPAPGDAFPEEKQEAWFAIARAAFRLIYKSEAAPISSAHRSEAGLGEE